MRNLWHRPATTYMISDAAVWVNCEAPPGDGILRFNEQVFRELRSVMKGAGYRFRQDQKVHKCIRSAHYEGWKDDVHFNFECSPRGFNIEFWEDVVRDNRHGGRYHFDKMAKMPYLRRLKVELIHRKLAARLEFLGFVDRTPITDAKSARGFVLQERAELQDFQGDEMYNPERRQPYNDTDANGVRIKDGEVRYYYDRYEGHLVRGEVWHHINNMWWVIVNEHDVRNVAAFEFFRYDQAIHPRRRPYDPVGRMERKLKTLVDREDFEKAIGLRDALRRERKPTEVSA